MNRRRSLTLITLALLLTALASIGCQNVDSNARPAAGNTDNGKIPITTSSAEARKEFLAGRDLADRLLIQDSLQHYDKAIALDSNFALAELTRAQASPTAKEFFDHLKKAVSLADNASNGERLLILGAEAGANGNPAKQKEYFEQLVAAYPNDERAHFNLGGYYFGQQDYTQAIAQYKKATELAPNYSGAYNILGYAYRQNGDYANAETAFKKYTELIPNDPNPYDSYGELLLKMGRFDESIAQYRKALSIDPNFAASHLGISADLMYQDKYDEAAAELQVINDRARSDGDRRTALFGLTVVDVDRGKLDQALTDMDKQYTLAEKIGDVAQMSGDLTTKANILMEMGRFDEARTLYERSLKMTQDSNLSKEIKDNAALFQHYNLAKVALGKKDLTAARKEAEEFSRAAEAAKNSAQIKQSHELMGMIALEEKDFDKALAEFQQANQQNPYDLYRLCQAYQGKNDAAKAKDSCAKAANFNSLPLLNYAFIRTKARKVSGDSKAD